MAIRLHVVISLKHIRYDIL